jgi:hypothetical protein
VPRLLTADKKRTRMKIYEKCLGRFNKTEIDLVRRFIPMDETWIHHYTPESKQQSNQWREAGCSAPKKTRCIASASVFWDAEGICLLIISKRVNQ